MLNATFYLINISALNCNIPKCVRKQASYADQFGPLPYP